jgi:hypothetical protein
MREIYFPLTAEKLIVIYIGKYTSTNRREVNTYIYEGTILPTNRWELNTDIWGSMLPTNHEEVNTDVQANYNNLRSLKMV